MMNENSIDFMTTISSDEFWTILNAISVDFVATPGLQ